MPWNWNWVTKIKGYWIIAYITPYSSTARIVTKDITVTEDSGHTLLHDTITDQVEERRAKSWDSIFVVVDTHFWSQKK